MVTKEQRWLEFGREIGAIYLVIATYGRSYDNSYPVFVYSYESLQEIIDRYRNAGQKIVSTSPIEPGA